ncbi:hypothetical protein LAZ67_3005939 [Cordylochernes scorpioides]|uniref:Uncharacterized protein n=1 Tax=Cordylochernes scorpioides TaxID=51811 RepID=A0ABY6KFH8_9ARAC|nr:hypothetical protein LAZ67_3005939 [Cordylochernes scorpioides]
MLFPHDNAQPHRCNVAAFKLFEDAVLRLVILREWPSGIFGIGRLGRLRGGGPRFGLRLSNGGKLGLL